MSNIEQLADLISTDVLVVGGGMGGEIAAVRAKENNPNSDVLLLDKQTIGYAGKASKGGGIFVVVEQGQSPDDFVKYHVENLGGYLEDQDLLLSYAQDSLGNIKDLDRWGITVCKDNQGNFQLEKNAFNGLWSFAAADLDMMLKLRSAARKLNVKTMNKIHIVDLLTQNNKVCGAIGFDIINGKLYIFKSKAVVLANGSCDYRGSQMWAAGTGDGIAAAYRAGVEMRNAEFANMCGNILTKDTDDVVDRRYIFNALGENIYSRYEPVPMPDMSFNLDLGIIKEISEGRGPLYIDLSAKPASASNLLGDFRNWNRPVMNGYKSRDMQKKKEFMSSNKPASAKREICLRQISELSCIMVNHEMQTSLEGLFALGDACYDGSSIAGALAGPPAMLRGSGLGFALFSACRAGTAASKYATNTGTPSINSNQVKQAKQNILAPIEKKDGYSPADLLEEIQKVVFPANNSIIRSGDRLKSAIGQIEKLKRELPRLYAKDFHGLSKCHEVSSMLVCAEITFKAALERTESRGCHYREDYPKQNNKDWLKWVIVKEANGKMVISSQPVPISKYKNKPVKGG